MKPEEVCSGTPLVYSNASPALSTGSSPITPAPRTSWRRPCASVMRQCRVFNYTISITNKGTETVQLKTRYWRITDAHGRRQEVRGAGVIGEEPVLKAGEAFEYTSGVPLQTSSGFMTGSY